MAQIVLGKKEGIFNNVQRFSVTNIFNEDLTFTWGGSPFTIGAGKTVSLPSYLANTVIDQMVDKILLADMKAEEDAFYEKNPNTEPNKHRAQNFLNNPVKRAEIENRIATKLPLEKGSTESQLLAMQIREELENDMKKEVSTTPPVIPVSAVGAFSQSSMEEFAELGKEETTVEKKPLKIKAIK